MNSSERDNVDRCMPPPNRILVQGSEEYRLALESGVLELSLPASSNVPPRTPSDTLNLATVGIRTPPRFSRNPIVSPEERIVDYASMNSSLEDEALDSTCEVSSYTPCTYPLASTPHSTTMNEFDGSSSNVDDTIDMTVDQDIASLQPREETVSLSRERVRPSSRNHLEQTRFADIIGHANAKLHMEELLLPLALPPEVADTIFTGARAMPASVLLYGPPGCGKVRCGCSF
jgi:hypothetical protein